MKTNTIITIGDNSEVQDGRSGIRSQIISESSCMIKRCSAEQRKKVVSVRKIFETHDEKPTNSFLYSLVMDTYSMGYSGGSYSDMPINHKVFLAQFDAIKKIADEGPCILVGRCADYALESYDNVVNVFIHADLDARIRRIARIYNLTDAKAKDMIIKTDKKRASYYNYYTNKKWSDSESYELCLSSSELGIEGTAKAIEQYVMLKEQIQRDDKIL